MKDPTGLHYEIEDGDGFIQGECSADGEDWPCKTIRRWRKTPEYRLKELEDKVERLGLSNAALRIEGNRMRQQLHELDLIVNGGVVLALQDLMRPGGGQLTVTRTVDMVDVSMFDGFRQAVPGRTEFNVEYKSANGSVWKNNQLIERQTPSWP